MGEIALGIKGAIELLISLDREIYQIILLSIYVSLTSTFFSTFLAVPAGIFLGLFDFRGKGLIIRFLYTLMSLPPVIAGLVVFLFISRKGPLGHLGLNFSLLP